MKGEKALRKQKKSINLNHDYLELGKAEMLKSSFNVTEVKNLNWKL